MKPETHFFRIRRSQTGIDIVLNDGGDVVNGEVAEVSPLGEGRRLEGTVVDRLQLSIDWIDREKSRVREGVGRI